MPKPKLPEEDKKEVVPLRLPKDAIAAVDRIAENWTEQKGKEIKRATVARELLLIGLGAFSAIQESPMFTAYTKKQSAQYAKKSLTHEEEDLLTRFQRLPFESQTLIKELLRSDTPKQPHNDEHPDDFVMELGEPTEPTIPHRRGGRR